MSLSTSASASSSSNNNNNKKSFVVLVDDFKDADAINRRLAVRQKHLEGATNNRRNDVLVSGGAILDSHETSKMVGSVLIFNAESKEELLEILKRDPYTTNKVWDLGSLKILPYKGAKF
ncbi:hypothetical protein GGI12_000481 [Dipsacomyces acuminosporus]|nr:hypothetical protein GGI12_000481 [Dipsacomyces acuminosporus]